MKRTPSRLLSLLLVFTMLVSVMPMASAVGAEDVKTENELKNAIISAGEGDTITLGRNIKLAEEPLAIGKKITLALGTYNIEAAADLSAINLTSGADVTITGTGTITGNNNGIYVPSGATLMVDGPTIKATKFNGVHNGGSVIVNDGTLSGGSSIYSEEDECTYHYNGIYTYDGTVTVSGGTVNGISIGGGTVAVNGGTIAKNSEGDSFPAGSGTLNITNGTVEGWMSPALTTTITGGTFNGNVFANQVTGGTFNALLTMNGENPSITGAKINNKFTWWSSTVPEVTNVTFGANATLTANDKGAETEDYQINADRNGIEKKTYYTVTVNSEEGGSHEVTVNLNGTNVATRSSNVYTNPKAIAGDVYKVTVSTTASDGYTFDGWYLNDVKTEPTDGVISFNVAGNTTLIAKFVSKDLAGKAQEFFKDYATTKEYTISTTDGMELFAYAVSNLGYTFEDKTVKLGNNLDFTGKTYRVVGNETYAFKGIFDGAGHTISNISATTGGKFIGLFGKVSGATVQNLNLKDSAFDNGGTGYAGGIVAEAGTNVTIQDCTITNVTTSAWFSGSVAGHTYGGVTVERVTVTGCTANGSKAGNVIGYSDSITMKNVTVSDVEAGAALIGHANAGANVMVDVKVNAPNANLIGMTYSGSEGTIKFTGDDTEIVAKDVFGSTVSDSKTVTVEAGKFTTDGTDKLDVRDYLPADKKQNADGSIAKAVAEYNGTKYESLQEAIDAASQRNGGQTEVTLLSNVTVTETITFAKKFSDGSVLLDLDGYTLTGKGCRALQINKGNLYLRNGTVTSTGIINSSSVIRVGSDEAQYSGVSPMLYMQKDAKVLAPDSYGVTIFGSKTVSEKLTVASNASIVATGDSPAISGNGDKAYHMDGKGTQITITGNAVVSATNNYAIYHPDNGSVSIESSAAVTGKGGIQMCSGTLKISGNPKIEAVGKADHETGAAGPIYDIAAISVVNRGYPGGAPVVTIQGTPTVTTVDGEVIHAYTWSSNAESEWAEAGSNINVSGGTYNKTFNEAYLAADCKLVENGEGSYTIEQKPVAKIGDKTYTSLSQAILDANKTGGKVKLLDNVTLTNSLGIGGTAAVTLDLNKMTLTLDGAQIYTQGSATVTINNGTIKRIDMPTSGSASNFAIQVMSGSSLIIGGGTGNTCKVTLESTYGIYNVGGTLNVRYATITTDGWSIAVSDSASKTGEVYIGRGMGGNTKTVITSESGNVLGTMVNSKPNVTIDYGTLTSNGTAWDAGVVYWASEGTLTITGGIFNASSAEGSTAAAVYQKNGTVKISGATTKLLGSNALVVKAGDGSTGTMVTELSSGTYSTKPDESWLATGKEIYETADGLYKVEGEYVVEVTHADGTVKQFDAWAKLASVWNESGATIKLLKDTSTAELVATNGKLTIDFNGKTLTVTKDAGSTATLQAAIVVQKGGELILTDSVGNGGLTTTNVYGAEVITGSTLTIRSGNYNCFTSVVQVDNGTAYIRGGTFKTKDEEKIYLLNCIDEAFKANTAVIEVTGGTFYGFDPANNTAEGAGTNFVKSGYVSTDNGDGTYTVEEYKPVEVRASYNGAAEAKYATIEEAVANCGKNAWLAITGDYTISADYTIPEGVGIDVQANATLTIAEGVTLTIAAKAQRLGVKIGATVVNNGTILVMGRGTNTYNESKVTVFGNGKIDIDKLTVPDGMFLEQNGSSYYAAVALFDIAYSDGTTKKASNLSNLTGATKATMLTDVRNFSANLDGGVADGFILDLNGFTMSGKEDATTQVLRITASVTIQNGTIKYVGAKTDNGALMTSADVTIAANATIDGGNGYAIWTDGYGHTLTVNGTIKTDGAYAITSNGSENGGNIADCDITVNAGAKIEAPKGIAIYHPEKGTVTINGGTITGHTGIEMCAGKLIVSGGSITSTGANWDATGSQNAILDGATISIINRNYPGGVPTAEITGGTIRATGKGAQTVKAYDYTNNEVAEWTNVSESVNISGGTFSSIPDNMAALCASGYTATKNTDGSYGVRRVSSSSSSSGSSTSAITTPSKTENGTVTVSPKSASKGDTVTITVKPDSGYVLGSLTVTDSKGNKLTLTDKGDGKYTFTMPSGRVEVKASFTKEVETSPFADVATDAYYYEAVKWAVKNSITTGVGDNLFAPGQPCTRAQIVTFLWRAAGSPEPKGTAAGMTDVVSGSYYEKAVAWAVENGVTTGTTATTFSPDATCTRAQAVTFLARALNAKAAGKAEFSDVPTDSYFANAVAWAAANGVTEGVGNGLFAPDNDCTRGQIVTFLYRAYNK